MEDTDIPFVGDAFTRRGLRGDLRHACAASGEGSVAVAGKGKGEIEAADALTPST